MTVAAFFVMALASEAAAHSDPLQEPFRAPEKRRGDDGADVPEGRSEVNGSSSPGMVGSKTQGPLRRARKQQAAARWELLDQRLQRCEEQLVTVASLFDGDVVCTVQELVRIEVFNLLRGAASHVASGPPPGLQGGLAEEPGPEVEHEVNACKSRTLDKNNSIEDDDGSEASSISSSEVGCLEPDMETSPAPFAAGGTACRLIEEAHGVEAASSPPGEVCAAHLFQDDGEFDSLILSPADDGASEPENLFKADDSWIVKGNGEEPDGAPAPVEQVSWASCVAPDETDALKQKGDQVMRKWAAMAGSGSPQPASCASSSCSPTSGKFSEGATELANSAQDVKHGKAAMVTAPPSDAFQLALPSDGRGDVFGRFFNQDAVKKSKKSEELGHASSSAGPDGKLPLCAAAVGVSNETTDEDGKSGHDVVHIVLDYDGLSKVVVLKRSDGLHKLSVAIYRAVMRMHRDLKRKVQRNTAFMLIDPSKSVHVYADDILDDERQIVRIDVILDPGGKHTDPGLDMMIRELWERHPSGGKASLS